MAQKMEAIGKLTGGIAHDFNNLLMIIGGNAQTFKRLLDPKLPRAIEAIQTAAKRGESLTRQLLTFSRRQHLTPTVVDLNACVRTCRPMIESSLRGNIVYDEKIDPAGRPVKVDLAELELAIVNIAVNARDAMPNGGTFRDLDRQRAVDEPTAMTQDDDFVAIEFTDTGSGIPPDLLARSSIRSSPPRRSARAPASACRRSMASPTSRADRQGRQQGRRRHDDHGLSAVAATRRSPTDEGDQLDDAACARPDGADRRRQRRGRRGDVVAVRASRLSTPSIGNSAEAALKLLAEGTKIDLVFSDIVMPGTIDGVGLASEVRSRYPHLPVILTTGYSDAAQAAPADLKILRKPFDTDALRGFLKEAMDMRVSS